MHAKAPVAAALIGLTLLAATVPFGAALVDDLAPVVAPSTSSSARGPQQNDAGSGGDAPDAPGNALGVGKGPTFQATLHPSGVDRDWFQVDREGAAVCAVASARSSVPGTLVLSTDNSLDTSVARSLSPSTTQYLTLATATGTHALLGLQPPPSFLMSSDSDQVATQPGAYRFSMNAWSVADLDPEGDGEGADAGPTPALAQPLPFACTAGRLSPGGGDDVDVFSLPSRQGDLLTAAVAPAGDVDVRLRVLDPTGAVRATAAAEEPVSVAVDVDGTWYYEVAAVGGASFDVAAKGDLSDGGDYLLSSTSDEPGTNPCRPGCEVT